MVAPTQRLSAVEIFEAASQSARDELARATPALAVSGFAAGITMGLTGLGLAAIHSYLGFARSTDLVAMLLYPLGFMAVIVGRLQLFTENTLYPVLLVLTERRHVRNTLRLWVTVFAANIAGTLIFAFIAAKTPALLPEVRDALVELGSKSAVGDFVQLFARGILGGWLIAMVAWLVTASQRTIGQLAVIWLYTFLVGIGHFAHCIAGSAEILTSVLAGKVAAFTYLKWITAATIGNVCGGVFLVSALNYGQVHAGE
jgi:formate/nitrite transporter FocA (FNT family)